MTAKKTMRAAYISEFGGIEKIKFGQLPIREPSDNEVQIQVEYAGVNPVDWKICEGLLKSRLPYEFPIILGWDVAGTISKIGKDVQGFKIGDPVFAYCRKDTVHEGSFAEYISLDAENVAIKPSKISSEQAAAVPLCSLTAWQSLFDSAHLRPKEHVLIHAGAGGVGSFAIQFAKYTGAFVITTASKKNFDYVKKLGADAVIDYTKEDFAQKVHDLEKEGVDVVYDTVGGETLKKSYDAAKIGGRIITIAGTIDKTIALQKKLFSDFVFVAPNGKELKRISALIDEEAIKVPKITEYPFDELTTALRSSKEGHTQGKIVIKVKS